MKKFYILVASFFIISFVNAQIINIPDAALKSRLLSASASNGYAKDINGNSVKIDANSNNQIEVSEALNIYWLDCSGVGNTNITGLEYFTNLKTLLGGNNGALQGHIDFSMLTNLEVLAFNTSPITSVNISGLVKLRSLTANHTFLTSIDLTGMTQMQFISLESNQYLTGVDASDCHVLQSITIGACPLLKTLLIKNGSIENTVEFSASNHLKYICGDEAQLADLQTNASTWDILGVVFNTYCSFTPGGEFYTITGTQKFDANSNGCDASDILYPELKFNITNGAVSSTLIEDLSGNHNIAVQAGTHTIAPILGNPTYFNVSPTSATITFPTQTSPFVQSFCITPNGSHPDLEVTLLPMTIAQPGFDCSYRLVYKNKGNIMQSGSVSLAYNSLVLDSYSSNPPVATVANSLLTWDFANLLPFETREIIVTLNLNAPFENPPVSIGYILPLTATISSSAIDETPNDNTSVLSQKVVGSFDPNDKTCLEGATITPEMVGKEVHYLIRFENTGTANAQNIVVKDVIDTSKFDINSLIPIDGSHSFITKISNSNKVEFIFENINLPFDNANNDGYVAFKIKTKPNLVLGNTFSNNASIYFDYNAPIITNTATTTVALLANQDFEFEQYFKIYPNPAHDVLNIETKKTIEVTSINIYNILGQVVLVIPNAQQTKSVDVSSLKNGNYLMKVYSDRGSSSVKVVKI